MMSDFAQAVEVVLRHEGGFCHHPNDPGGATNYGISERYLERKLGRQVGADEIRALTREHAIEIYRKDFWLPAYSAIDSQLVATKILDMAVNMGHGQAHQLLQHALNDLGEDLDIDGQLGPLTLAAISAHGAQKILEVLVARQQKFYRGLVASEPRRQAFLADWLYRAQWPLTGPQKQEA